MKFNFNAVPPTMSCCSSVFAFTMVPVYEYKDHVSTHESCSLATIMSIFCHTVYESLLRCFLIWKSFLSHRLWVNTPVPSPCKSLFCHTAYELLLRCLIPIYPFDLISLIEIFKIAWVIVIDSLFKTKFHISILSQNFSDDPPCSFSRKLQL